MWWNDCQFPFETWNIKSFTLIPILLSINGHFTIINAARFEFLNYASKKCLQIRFNWWLEGTTTESFILMAWPSKIGIEKIRTTLWKKYLPPQLGCFWPCDGKHKHHNAPLQPSRMRARGVKIGVDATWFHHPTVFAGARTDSRQEQ